MGRIMKIVEKKLPLFLAILAAIFCTLFFLPSKHTSISDKAERIQRIVNDREKILEEFAYEALNTPENERVVLSNLPKDMVIYRYVADTLQSWCNLFNIENDDYTSYNNRYYSDYRLHYLDWNNRFLNPLSSIENKERFLNIGLSWYVVRPYFKGNVKVIAALLIKTSAQLSDATDIPQINRKLKIEEGYDIVPISEDVGAVVESKNGEPLFSIVEDISDRRDTVNKALLWLSILSLFIALFLYYFRKRDFNHFLLFIAGATILRILCYLAKNFYETSSLFFSPKLYADRALFDSVGDLLLNNLYVSAVAIALYMLRDTLIKLLEDKRQIVKWSITTLLWIVPLSLFLYINFTLRSLVNNSSIVMELYRVTHLDRYTLLCFFSYAILFLALMFSLQVVIQSLGMRAKRYILSYNNTLLYVLAISLYVLFTISVCGAKKEERWSNLFANKISVERDLGLEMELRRIEQNIKSDIESLKFLGRSQNTLNQLEERFSELYFQRIKQNYMISLTICRQDDVLQIGSRIDNCLNYYSSLLALYDAVPISEQSSFFYLSNYKGKIGYIGIFYYDVPNLPLNLFIEINSKSSEESSGYPYRLTDRADNSLLNLSVPFNYSYAKYSDSKLMFNEGEYDYPLISEYGNSADYTFKSGNYVHFVRNVADANQVVISRPKRSIFPYIVSFSYIALFFGAIFFIIIRSKYLIRRTKNAIIGNRKSISKQMMFFVTAMISVTLLSLGIGSVWFSIKYYNANIKSQMEEKIQLAKKSFSSYFEFANRSAYISGDDLLAEGNNDFFRAMERVASEVQTDINIFYPNGKLYHSTKQELFSRFMLSGRMNPFAYKKIMDENRSQVRCKEHIGSISYMSIYAPLYDDNSNVIAIVNIPYFTSDKNLSDTLSPIIATIINVLILLLLVSLFFARIIAKRLTRPLAKLSSRMSFIDVTETPEHINYKKKDELGILVESYNKMVDSLAYSTKQIAQNEREKAWGDMARQIAHEIKNPLTPMKLSIQRMIMLKQRGAQGWEDKVGDICNSLLEQIDILSNTASEFSSYAKFYVEDSSVINLYDIIKEEMVLFDNRDDIRISFAHSSTECYVYARKGQIIRVVVNLVSNAIQALEHLDNKGFIRVSLNAQDDKYIVSVEDNGNGVNDEDRDKLFTPNFTTKSSGNGLGLAISKSIIEQSGGEIWYNRSSLGGAEFAFSLPIFKKDNN